ncbi:hypothetical protein B0H13DRAFT_1908585 [Mycena leptocephala]|nr:hypothetical protein B0H13DRAFT_1908585 [Mycena leptocephala]
MNLEKATLVFALNALGDALFVLAVMIMIVIALFVSWVRYSLMDALLADLLFTFVYNHYFALKDVPWELLETQTPTYEGVKTGNWMCFVGHWRSISPILGTSRNYPNYCPLLLLITSPRFQTIVNYRELSGKRGILH